MERVRLRLVERVYIYIRCRRDFISKKFRDMESRMPVSRQFYFNNDKVEKSDSQREKSQKMRGSELYLADYNYRQDDYPKVISPFVITELSHLIAKKNQILTKKICCLKYKNSNRLQHKIKRFPNAIAEIEDMIRVLEAGIDSLDEEYSAAIDLLQKKYNSNKTRGEVRLAEACIKDARTKQEKLRVEKKKKYETIIALVSEKQRLITIINAHIEAVKAQYFLRIRHYYGVACNISSRFPVFVYSEEDFSSISHEEFNGDYTGKFEETVKKYSDIKKAMSFLNEKTIHEVDDLMERHVVNKNATVISKEKNDKTE